MFFFGFGGSNESFSKDNEDTVLTKVDQINFDGDCERTKHDIIKELVKPILQSRTLKETLHNVQAVRQRFYELGLFRNVQVSVEAANEDHQTEGPIDLAVSFNVEETKRYTGGFYISGNQNEVSGNIELKAPNLLGRGEGVRAQFEKTWKYYDSWSATVTKPLITTPWQSLRSDLEMTVLQSSKNCPWSNYKELDRSLIAALNIQPHQSHRHTLQWESSWRKLSSGKDADFEVSELMDHSLKSSASHIYTYDTRDNPIIPEKGTLFRLVNEFAGFQKNAVSFRKHELGLQHNFCRFFQFSVKGGCLQPIDNVSICDKFFLGGPLNLRGFQMFGIGQHGEKNMSALGATKYWVGALHLQYPLPLKNSYNQYLRLHGFVNAGTLSDKLDDFKDKNNIRMSYGVGLIFSFAHNIRLELNYCVPYSFKPEDKLNKGIQFGIGMTYV